MDVMDPSLVVALSERGRGRGREAFRAWNIHETEAWTSETRLSPTRPRYPFFRCRRHGIKSRGSRSSKLILEGRVGVSSPFLVLREISIITNGRNNFFILSRMYAPN